MRYIELNMVRCGAVPHPSEWQWVGYHEIVGDRQRYRLLDLDRLCWRLQTDRLDAVRQNLEATLKETIARDEMKREPCWTESLAVGSQAFVERIKPLVLSPSETEIVEDSPGLWVLRDVEVPYMAKAGSKAAPKVG